MTDKTFGARLWAAIRERGPLCAGIDPHAALLSAWGLPDDANGAERFARTVVEALADTVPLVKPQVAFFERFGAAGIAALERTISDARAAGLLVLTDAKRGDIGTTAEAYARAFLNPAAPLFSDALTVSPYLGFGSLQPFLDAAHDNGCGVFVLALTSNPEGPEVQHARTPDGRTVAGTLLAHVAAANAGAAPQGSVGVVVGATIGRTGEDLAVNGPILVPGLGAQGGGADDLRRIFAGVSGHVVPAVSREILRAGPSISGLRAAADEAVGAFAAALR
jgi:orotidine-5'-phosphate decarboxylase